ncbi:MAG: hypothetical protein O6761_06955 [Thaumarchaeota archaeon]|nr:hypothetical protein [Nitrososphaerota archaeon]
MDAATQSEITKEVSKHLAFIGRKRTKKKKSDLSLVKLIEMDPKVLKNLEKRSKLWLKEQKEESKALAIATASRIKNKKNRQIALAALDEEESKRRISGGVILNRIIKIVEAVNSPYTDFDKRRFELAVRRSVTVRLALILRDFFAFGRDSKLVLELIPSETIGMKPADITAQTEKITLKNKKLIQRLQRRDDLVDIEKVTHQFFWQKIIFANAVLIKGYPLDKETRGILAEPIDLSEGSIIKLVSINSRRLGNVIVDVDNYNEFEGIYVDGQALDRLSMIYGAHHEYNLSPYTQHHGYTPMETIVDLASSSVTFDSEDTPEILKSLWAASILLNIDTSDLSDPDDKQDRIDKIVDLADPGRILGVDKEVGVEKLDFDANYDGLGKFADRTDLKIFKAFQVPQSLVQSEDMANKATADSSGTLFLDGTVTSDQNEWSKILWKQWYEPYIREMIAVEKDEDDPDDKPVGLTFRIMRKWDKITNEQFMELVNGIVQLVNAGIWDIQKANEKLQSEEVTQRVTMEDLENPNQPFNDKEGKLNESGNLPDRTSHQAIPDNSVIKQKIKKRVPIKKPINAAATAAPTHQEVRTAKLDLIRKLGKHIASKRS